MRDCTLDERLGQCFKCAAQYVLDENQEFLVAHGFCIGTGGETLNRRFVHAWAEHPDGNVVFDPVYRRTMRRCVFYQAGSVSEVRKYTYDQLLELLLKHKHWGPWDRQLTGSI